jgi:hypothetical protein
MPILRQPQPDPFAGLASALDAEAWDRLTRYHPLIADEVTDLIEGGQTPSDVCRFIIGHTGRYQFACWCEQAARHLEAEG